MNQKCTWIPLPAMWWIACKNVWILNFAIQNPTQEKTQCYAIQSKYLNGSLCRCIRECTPKLAVLQVQCNNAVVHTVVGTGSFYMAMLSTPSLQGWGRVSCFWRLSISPCPPLQSSFSPCTATNWRSISSKCACKQHVGGQQNGESREGSTFPLNPNSSDAGVSASASVLVASITWAHALKSKWKQGCIIGQKMAMQGSCF